MIMAIDMRLSFNATYQAILAEELEAALQAE